MSSAYQPLIPATPRFNAQGIACSTSYDDLYHSASGALEQARYVFLQGNGLPQRWRQRQQFTILETGFGLGNNFLATWEAWRQDPQRSQRLHFVSFEAHPFTASDLAHMLASTPASLRDLADQLIAQWPLLVPGIHRLEFEQGALTLTLCLGDIHTMSHRMQCYADAFYLDGFAPRVNPAMWSAKLFGQLVRMSAPGATAATWCSATQVRTDLQNAGFIVERHPGFAFKRHMIKAQLREHLGHPYASIPTEAVHIIGGGIAGAATAYALALRGIASVVFDPVFTQGLGGAHAGHAAVALRPVFSVDDPPRARLSRAGVLWAAKRWLPLSPSVQRCPAWVPAADAAEANLQRQSVNTLELDTDWVQYRAVASDGLPTTEWAPYGGLWFPQALMARPEQLIKQLLSHPLIRTNTQPIVAIETHEQGWLVRAADATAYIASQVVLANAAGAHPLLAAQVPSHHMPRFQSMDLLGGQSEHVHNAQWPVNPKHMTAGNGYVIPLGNQQYVVGSTYTAEPKQWPSWAEHQQIMQKVHGLLPGQTQSIELCSAWYGQRAAMADHMPVLGQVKPGLWLNAAYGSYGFSWAALSAEVISTQLAAEPAVIERDVLRALFLR